MAKYTKIGHITCIAFILAQFICVSVKAQLISDLHTLYEPTYCHPMLDTMAYKTPFGTIAPGINYGLSMGTSVGLFGGGNGLTNAYIAPKISYAPNEKLQVVGGIAVARASLIGTAQPNVLGQSAPLPASSTPLQAWAYAQYNLNHKLQIYATGTVQSNQPCYSMYGAGLGTYNAQMLGVGLNYSLGSRTTLGFQVSMERSDAPMLLYRNAHGMRSLWGW